MKLKKSFPAGIRNIIFDLGGVIVDIDVAATLHAFEKLNIGGLDISAIHPHQQGFFLDYELGDITGEEFISAIRARYGCEGVADAQIWAAWTALLQKPDMARFGLLENVRGNYNIYLLSNTNKAHIDAVKEGFRQVSGGREFETFFDGCFYSHRMHLRKPGERIYREVLELTGAFAGETIFIDDNECNFTGAKAAGLHVYHLTGGESINDLFK